MACKYTCPAAAEPLKLPPDGYNNVIIRVASTKLNCLQYQFISVSATLERRNGCTSIFKPAPSSASTAKLCQRVMVCLIKQARVNTQEARILSAVF